MRLVKLITVDASESGLTRGPFLCIKLNIDITKPLTRGKMVHIEELDEGWVFFKYERLLICYRCGAFGHYDCECPQLNLSCFLTDDDDF